MRFQNWDVLVFPTNDSTPIQEFTTEFCRIPDPDYEFLSRVTTESPETPGGENSKLLPTVSSYIPMLVPGTPFQISIHSWSPPKVEEHVDSGSKPMIEARVFIDGSPITYVVSPVIGAWPMIVDSYPINSAYGTRKRNLTFPAFNGDSINQWAKGDTELGRIKIVISEGVASGKVENGEVSYMRLKNLVCFYYRYAPQELLETVGIYYPTTRKFDNSLARWFPVSVPPHHFGGRSVFGSPTHSHSPTRKAFAPANAPPAFDLNAAAPSLENTAHPDLQPVSKSTTMYDPFTSHGNGTDGSPVNQGKGKVRMVYTGGEVEQPAYWNKPTIALTGSVHMVRPDSVSSFCSNQSTGAHSPNHAEQPLGKENGMNDSTMAKPAGLLKFDPQKQPQSNAEVEDGRGETSGSKNEDQDYIVQ